MALSGPGPWDAGPSTLVTGEDQQMYDPELDHSEYGDASSGSGDDYKEDDSEESEDNEDEDEDAEFLTDPRVGQGLDTLFQSAENQIENDFDALIRNIRQSDDTGAGALTQSWDFSLEDHEAEFRDDLRLATGIGKRGRKKGRRGRKPGPTLSPQVKELIGEANQAYVDNNIPETMRVMQEVIRIEPRASSAWSVLAQCYSDMKEDQKALQLRIMAAHLLHDPDEWDALARQSRDLGFTQQALYCYGKVYRLDPTNVNAMWDRASLAKQVGDIRVIRHALLSLLRQVPHDLAVLDELRPALVENNELELCATLYTHAFSHYQALFPTGVSTDTGQPGGGFGPMELLVLADLHNTLGQHADAVRVIRDGCRWLQGRGEQKFWEAVEDDREWDVEGTPGAVGREGEVKPGCFPMDVNARHRLAVARIKMGELNEGRMHASIVLNNEVVDYAPLFVEIADAYYERDLFMDARPIYESLGADAVTSSMYILLQTAECRRALGDLRESAEVYEHVIAADTTNNDAKMKLAEIYEILNEPRKALNLVYQVIDSRRRNPSGRSTSDANPDEPASSLIPEKGRGRTKSTLASAKKLTQDQLRELEHEREREVLRGYRRATELWLRVLEDGEVRGQAEAEREWLFEVDKLVETFRETRRLFTTSKEGFKGMTPAGGRRRKETTEASENDMASRLHLELAYDTMVRKHPEEKQKPVIAFRGVPIDDWLTLFIQYAFQLTKRNQYPLANEVLSHITFSSAFLSREAQDTIRLALIACAAAARQHTVVIQHARKLINGYQYNNEPFRLLSASLASGPGATDAFISNALQKAMLREVKSADTAVKNPEGMRWNALRKRWFPMAGSKHDEDDAEDDGVLEGGEQEKERRRLPVKENPLPVAMYGQMSNAGRSYQSAIFYLLHAYDYCPQDPVVCLSLAIASIGRAMQRQSDNRHHLIAQGMAFLTKYRAIRKSEAPDEVEFNFGRAFHQLGLYTLAARHYERVLELNNDKPEEEWGVAREAAYNLSTIYVTTGATPLARAIYTKWLSI